LETTPDPQDRWQTLAAVTTAHRRRVAKRASIAVAMTVAKEIGEERAQIALSCMSESPSSCPMKRAGRS
jgi:hypothetical protein